jgi:beta-1,4-mannosyl-glycoprotein beta-1,4-N-acetylglucosaminyltransferase
MLIDAFPLFNELDILELRLTELSPAVDRFVIVESNRTHKGTLKPLHYAENAQRFAEWKDKIVHVVVGDMPQGEGLAAIRRREMFQRNAILRGIEDCADDDIILISDCDEIPRLHLLPVALDDGVVVTYIQKLYYFNFNTHAPGRPWPGTRACRVADARALSPHVIRNGLAQTDAHYPRHGHIMNGGWHFSYFGGVDSIQTKMQEFLHQELVTSENTTPEAIAAQVTSGRDIWGREHEQEFVIGAADDLPYAVLRDLPKYAPHFADGWQPVFHEDWYAGGQAIYIGQLARSAPEGAIVEIGCWEGRSTITLAQMVSPRVVHCVDHWQGNIDEGEDHPATIAARERDVMADFMNNMDRLTDGNYTTIYRRIGRHGSQSGVVALTTPASPSSTLTPRMITTRCATAWRP